MNITFLIGNGFDLGMGMQSSFKDFFPIYYAWSRGKKESIRVLSEMIGEDHEKWSAFEIQMGKYTEAFDQSTKNLYIEQMRDFQLSLMEYLKRDEEQLSFEDMGKISKHMETALTTFWKGTVIAPESSDMVQGIIKKYLHQDMIYNFISFNYTKVLEKCLETIPERIVRKRQASGTTRTDRIGQIVHVHGDYDNSPIMGVNDVSQISNSELAQDVRFSRNIVKPKSNAMQRTNREKQAEKLINESNIVCIYGMSLGETDRNWWAHVLKWLKNNGEHQLVIFVHDSSFSKATQFDWIRKEDSIIDLLAEYADENIDVEAMRNRIHIAVHKNIFEMDLNEGRKAYDRLLDECFAVSAFS